MNLRESERYWERLEEESMRGAGGRKVKKGITELYFS